MWNVDVVVIFFVFELIVVDFFGMEFWFVVVLIYFVVYIFCKIFY